MFLTVRKYMLLRHLVFITLTMLYNHYHVHFQNSSFRVEILLPLNKNFSFVSLLSPDNSHFCYWYLTSVYPSYQWNYNYVILQLIFFKVHPYSIPEFLFHLRTNNDKDVIYLSITLFIIYFLSIHPQIFKLLSSLGHAHGAHNTQVGTNISFIYCFISFECILNSQITWGIRISDFQCSPKFKCNFFSYLKIYFILKKFGGSL